MFEIPIDINSIFFVIVSIALTSLELYKSQSSFIVLIFILDFLLKSSIKAGIEQYCSKHPLFPQGQSLPFGISTI